jgi:poly(3-hydroxybutyrate) depolymerase
MHDRMRRKNRAMHRCAGAALTLAMLATAACGRAADEAAAGARLEPLPIDRAGVTVSGPSAGGYMAVQFHVAHSRLVQGAGVLAAGPNLCAENSVRLGLGRCMKGDEPIPTDRLIQATSELALDDAIDPIAGLADDRVWIYHGAADPYVLPPVVDALETYYRALVEPDNVVRVERQAAGHAFPTADESAPGCSAFEPPYLANCGLDGAAALLGHLYGPLQPGREPVPSGLVEFDQRPYAAAAGTRSLAERGWLYVPSACAAGSRGACRLHVVFHGCKQGASFVGDQFLQRSGYLEIAETNRVVLLFPQVEPSFQPLNPNGCWDWWGYEGEAYATQAGPQVRAVRSMIADLLGRAATTAR